MTTIATVEPDPTLETILVQERRPWWGRHPVLALLLLAGAFYLWKR